MGSPVGHQSSRIVPVPPEIEVKPVAVEGALWRRPEPEIIVDRRGNRLVRNDWNIAHPVLVGPGLDESDLAEFTASDIFDRFGKL
jgi:hypothetical protein